MLDKINLDYEHIKSLVSIEIGLGKVKTDKISIHSQYKFFCSLFKKKFGLQYYVNFL